MSNQNPSKAVATKLKFTDAKANSFANKVLRWELLETKLAPLLDTMPHVKPVAAAEGLQTELGELLHADAIVLLDRLAQQSRQALALGEHLLELLL